MIEVKGIYKKYGSDYAVWDITFKVCSGETVGIYGRNGAGKTTIADIITGCIYADAGSVIVDGYDINKNPNKAKFKIGYMSESLPAYNEMTVEEYLAFICAIKRIPKNMTRQNIESAMDRVKAAAYGRQLLGSLSRDIVQKASLAGALCANPIILILDEPTASLGPDEADEMRSVIESLHGEYAIILLSQTVHEIAQICDSVIILNKGKIATQQNMESLRIKTGDQRRILVRLATDKKQGMSLLKAIRGADYVDCLGCNEGGTCDFVVESSETDLRAKIFSAAANANIVLLGMSSMSVTLEDIFMQLSGNEQASI